MSKLYEYSPLDVLNRLERLGDKLAGDNRRMPNTKDCKMIDKIAKEYGRQSGGGYIIDESYYGECVKRAAAGLRKARNVKQAEQFLNEFTLRMYDDLSSDLNEYEYSEDGAIGWEDLKDYYEFKALSYDATFEVLTLVRRAYKQLTRSLSKKPLVELAYTNMILYSALARGIWDTEEEANERSEEKEKEFSLKGCGLNQLYKNEALLTPELMTGKMVFNGKGDYVGGEEDAIYDVVNKLDYLVDLCIDSSETAKASDTAKQRILKELAYAKEEILVGPTDEEHISGALVKVDYIAQDRNRCSMKEITEDAFNSIETYVAGL